MSVGLAVMHHSWRRIGFLHWPLEPAAVQRLLPPGLQVDTFEGRAYAGIIPFQLVIRLPGPLRVPVAFEVPEINLRTYVRGPDGGRGIWFFSLDVTRRWLAVAARMTYRIPYFLADISLQRVVDRLRFDSRRRWPGRPGASCRVALEPGAEVAGGELDRFLTDRLRLYSSFGRRLLAADVDHPPWRLRRARILDCDQDLLAAAGLPPARGEPLALFSAGTDVRFGIPRPV